jgi:uncharacterized protein YpbB
MNISYVIMTDVFHKINGSRKTSGIYYILTGKKTSQSLSDSQWFNIEHYYAAFKGMSIETFQQIIKELDQLGIIVFKEENVYEVTKKGEAILSTESDRISFVTKLNGLKYAAVENQCWQVVTLYVQALSNALYHHYDYSPVIRDSQAVQRVKRIFPRSRHLKAEEAKLLYSEIYEVLNECDSTSADIFVKKLSGYERIGNTFEQSAREWGMSKSEIVLRFRSVLHHLLRKASDQQGNKVLHALLGDFTNIPALTKSASHTYKMLNQGKSVEEIMVIRNLKNSTLEDHLVEIAREIPGFSLHSYINEQDCDRIVRYYKETNETKLRPIKDAFPHLSYLQIRLVLAKEGGKNATGSST